MSNIYLNFKQIMKIATRKWATLNKQVWRSKYASGPLQEMQVGQFK